MRFDWDPLKARRNEAKHGVSFNEAVTVFRDRLAIIGADVDHSAEEAREFLVGQSVRQRLLVVIFAERYSTVRIISARPATRSERSGYEEQADI